MVDSPEAAEKSATGVIVIRKAKYEPVRWTAKDVAAAVAADAGEPGVKRKSRAEREKDREEERKQRLLDRINKKYGRLAAV